jgi:hypothetical protein
MITTRYYNSQLGDRPIYTHESFEVFTAVTEIMPSFGMLPRVTLLRTDISGGGIASIIMATRIGELGTTLTITKECFGY